MPTQAFGLYPAEGTLGDQVSSTYEGRHVTLYASEINHGNVLAVVTKGYPVIFGTIAGNHGVGIALNTEVAGTDLIAIDTEGIWNVSVVANDDLGASLVTGGDPLYINTTTAVVSKIRNNATQIPFGYALGQVTAAATAVIAVKVHWDPRSHWLEDDERLYFGDARDVDMGWDEATFTILPLVTDTGSVDIGNGTLILDMNWYGTAIGQYLRFDASADELINVGVAIRIPEDEVLEFGAPDHTFSWTGEEVDVSGDRVTGGDGDYYRVFHVSSGVTLGAVDRWGTISCYTVMSGAPTTATAAFGGSFSLVQETVQVTGFFGAVMAEIKNEADNCATACALFCRWDNDSAVGFGGVMHSFIRFEDNSSALNVQCLFELYLMDATAAAAADVIICQAGAAVAASHVIKISANGVPYWILMDSTPPA